jgi:hypothetical protein
LPEKGFFVMLTNEQIWGTGVKEGGMQSMAEFTDLKPGCINQDV